MKLVIAGSSGFLGSEVVRQSLKHPKITSVVALARSQVQLPAGEEAHETKLRSVVVDDYGTYPKHVIDELRGADACIWNVAITPTKSKEYPFDEVKRVCQENAVAALQAMLGARGHDKNIFRFLYVSGIAAERDQTKTPAFMPEYCLMRGQAENELLALAKTYNGVEVCVAKPGLITAPERKEDNDKILSQHPQLPYIARHDLAAAMISQSLHGFEKEPLLNADLVQIGQDLNAAGSG